MLLKEATRCYADAMRDKQFDVARKASLMAARYALECNKAAANAILATSVRPSTSFSSGVEPVS